MTNAVQRSRQLSNGWMTGWAAGLLVAASVAANAQTPPAAAPTSPPAPPGAGMMAPHGGPGHPMGHHMGQQMGPQGHRGGPQGHHGHHGHHGKMGHRAGGPIMMLLGPGLDRALDIAKANPEQRAEIRRIAGAVRDEMRASRRGDPAQNRDMWLKAWSADQVDASALEQQRQQQSARREAQSRRLVQAAVDIGKVLKPEQRRALAEHWRQQRPAGQRRAEFLDEWEHELPAAD